MSTLKKKNADGNWQTIATAEQFPAQIPVRLIDADLTTMTVTENGHYYPQAPNDGFSDFVVDIPPIYAAIVVHYNLGFTCTCTNGTTTLTATDTTGNYSFLLPEAGNWTITATNGSTTQTVTLSITDESQGEFVNFRVPALYFSGEFYRDITVNGELAVNGRILQDGDVVEGVLYTYGLIVANFYTITYNGTEYYITEKSDPPVKLDCYGTNIELFGRKVTGTAVETVQQPFQVTYHEV